MVYYFCSLLNFQGHCLGVCYEWMQILSNGRLKSSKHRARTNNVSSRISIAAFCLPGNPDVMISPLTNFVDGLHPPSYAAMSYFKYSSLYFNRDMKTKPLSLLDHYSGNNQWILQKPTQILTLSNDYCRVLEFDGLPTDGLNHLWGPYGISGGIWRNSYSCFDIDLTLVD